VRFRWFGRRARNAPRAAASAPLREFVYLDDVSVYSLLTSREGELVSEVKETQGQSTSSRLTSTAGARAVVQAEIGSEIETANRSESQVIRKAIIQSTFRRLIDAERPRLVIGNVDPFTPDEDAPFESLSDSRLVAWVIDPAALKRGELLELTVELQADQLYEVTTAMNVVFKVIKSNPQLGIAAEGELDEAETAQRILNEFLTGLVPLKGECVDWVVARLGGMERIVHRTLADYLVTASADIEITPLVVVGVAQEDLFWKDIRRVVFSRSRYQVLCRLGRDGTHTSWEPVKLADVFRTVAPPLAGQWDTLGETLREALIAGAAEVEMTEAPASEFDFEFALKLVARHGGDESVARRAIETVEQTVPTDAARAISTEGREKLFSIAAAVGELLGVDIDREEAAGVRSELVSRHFSDDGAAASYEPSPVAHRPMPNARYLDSEIVAIYW
jgi:hypothetical protein